MKYSILTVNCGTETTLSASQYACILTVWIKPTNINIPNFFKEIEVVSGNELTGYEVDTQRDLEVSKYMTSINL